MPWPWPACSSALPWGPEHLLCQPEPPNIPAIRLFGLHAHWARFGILTNCSQANNLIINFLFSWRKRELWADMPLKRACHAPKSSATQIVYAKRAYPWHFYMKFPSHTTQNITQKEKAYEALSTSGQSPWKYKRAISPAFPCQLQHGFGCFASPNQSRAAWARWENLAFCTRGDLFETGSTEDVWADSPPGWGAALHQPLCSPKKASPLQLWDLHPKAPISAWKELPTSWWSTGNWGHGITPRHY